MISRLPIEHGREVILHFTIKLTDDSVADSPKCQANRRSFAWAMAH